MSKQHPRIIVQLFIAIYREKNYWVAHCPALKLSAVAKTEKLVKKEFHNSYKLWVKTVLKEDALDEILKNLGWEYKGNEIKPPKTITTYPASGACISMTENMPIPLQAMA